MSKVKALYHIVFCTKNRNMTLPLSHLDDVFRFIWKDSEDMKCRLVRIGGIQNHLHLLVDLHPTVALATYVREIKSRSSAWLRGDLRFPNYEGWGREYYATTISERDQKSVIGYIDSQREHHQQVNFNDELTRLHQVAGLLYNEMDMR